MTRNARSSRFALPLLIIALILVVVALRELQILFMPMAITVFLVMLLRPIERGVYRVIPWRIVSIGAAALIMILALAVFGGAVGWVAMHAAEEFPKHWDRVTEHWDWFEQWGTDQGIPMEALYEDNDWVKDWVEWGLLTTQAAVAGLILVFFLVILSLLEVDSWRDKLRSSAASETSDRTLLDIVDVSTQRMRKFMAVLTLMSALSGITGGIWLWIIGVELFYLWAMLIFILNYLPIVGATVAAIPPILMALIQADGGVGLALAAALGLLATEQTIGNFFQPRIQGRVHHLSPLVVLLALLFWGWVWGIIGAFLALPLTILLMVFLAHFPATRTLALLMSDISDYEILRGATTGQRERDGH